jgi:hypothetical protein
MLKKFGASGLSQYSASDSLLLGEQEYISFHKPTEIMISRHFPGYRVFESTGQGADEALGRLLAQTLDSENALEEFRMILSSPELATSIITKLLPRAAVPVTRGKYLITESQISMTTEQVLKSSALALDVVVIAALAHVITRVLTHLGLVLPGEQKKYVATAQNLALSKADLKKVILIESLRDVFSEGRIAEAVTRLNQDATPNIIAEVIGKMLRQSSHSIPEIRLRLEQLEIVSALIQAFYRRPETLSNTMRASTTLASLASYANFLAEAVVEGRPAHSNASNSDMREACAAIQTIISAAPSIDIIPLTKYADYFGVVPCSSADGIYRGVVTYLPMAQTSTLDIVNANTKVDGAELALMANEYVPTTAIASEIARTLTSVEAMEGLANLVADEIAASAWELEDRPILRTIGFDETALVYLAMAHAEITAVTKSDDTNQPFRLLYAAKVAEHWRTRLAASTPSIAYFADAPSLLIYQTGAVAKIPTVMPARMQSIALSAAFDTLYQGNIREHISFDVEKPFSFILELMNPDSEEKTTSLKCRISPLELLVGPEPDLDRGGSHYGIIKEPGVDRDTMICLALAAAYASAGPDVITDKAKSWLVEVLTPLATHPAITRAAVRALNSAVITAKLDARRLAPQYKEAVVRAYFSTLLGLLGRFGKVDETIKEVILKALPVNSLTVKAALSLATMPTEVDASTH